MRTPVPQNNDGTKLSLPITLAASLFVSAVTGTVAAMGSAYSLRDGMVERINREMEKSMQQTRQERNEHLRYYVSKESFADWRQQERIRSDKQYYSLLNAIERLGLRMEH